MPSRRARAWGRSCVARQRPAPTWALAFGLLLAAARPAEADSFASLDRPAPSEQSSELSLDVALLYLDEPLLASFIALRLDPSATFYSDSQRYAVHMTLPLAIGRQDGESATALANIDIAGFYLTELAPGLAAIARLGATLPTASSRGDGATINAAAAAARVTDVILAMPATSSGRAAVSLIASRGQWVARADIGIDVPLVETGALIDELSHKPVGRANLALAFRSSPQAIGWAIESANVIGADNALSSTGAPADSSALHQLALTARRRSLLLGLFTDPARLLGSGDGLAVGAFVVLGGNGTK